MLLLAYLMTRGDEWDGVKIRVLAADCEEKTKKTREDLRKTIEEARIEAETKVVVDACADVIVKHSSDASMVFLPFRLRGNQVLDPFGETIDKLLIGLPLVALVLAAEEIKLDAEPEEGKAGETAVALDALADAEKKARETEKESKKAADRAEKEMNEMHEGAISETRGEKIEKLEGEALNAQEQTKEAARKALEAAAEAEKAAEKVGGTWTKISLLKQMIYSRKPRKGKGCNRVAQA